MNENPSESAPESAPESESARTGRGSYFSVSALTKEVRARFHTMRDELGIPNDTRHARKVAGAFARFAARTMLNAGWKPEAILGILHLSLQQEVDEALAEAVAMRRTYGDEGRADETPSAPAAEAASE